MSEAILRKLQESTNHIVNGETEGEQEQGLQRQPSVSRKQQQQPQHQQSSVVTLSKEEYLQYKIDAIITRDNMMQRYNTHSSKTLKTLQDAQAHSHNRRRRALTTSTTVTASSTSTVTQSGTNKSSSIKAQGGASNATAGAAVVVGPRNRQVGLLPPRTSHKQAYKKAKEAKTLLAIAKKLKKIKKQSK